MTLEELLDLATTNSYSQEKRDYIGASLIGNECRRYIWLSHKNTPCEKPKPEHIRAMDDGHRVEEYIINLLKKAGITIFEKADGGQFGFIDNGFGGHYDAIGKGFPQCGDRVAVIEVKAVNEKKFKELCKLKQEDEKTALSKWDQVYYAQGMVYCKYANVSDHILIVTTPGGRQIITVHTNANNDFADALKDKAMMLFGDEAPPVIGNKDFFICKMCRYHKTCHGT